MKKVSKLLLLVLMLTLCIGLMTATALAADWDLNINGKTVTSAADSDIPSGASISYANGTYTITVNSTISEPLKITSDKNLVMKAKDNSSIDRLVSGKLEISASGAVEIKNQNGYICSNGAEINGKSIDIAGNYDGALIAVGATKLTATDGDVHMKNDSGSLVQAPLTILNAKNVTLEGNCGSRLVFGALDIEASGAVEIKNQNGYICSNGAEINGKSIDITGNFGVYDKDGKYSYGALITVGATKLTATDGDVTLSNPKGKINSNINTDNSIKGRNITVTGNADCLFSGKFDITADGAVKLVNNGAGNVAGNSLSVKSANQGFCSGKTPKINIEVTYADAEINVSTNPDGSSGQAWDGTTDPSDYRYLEIKDPTALSDDDVVLSNAFLPFVVEAPFIDVSFNDWFFEPVNFVYANELMVGTSRWTFDPNTAITRGMLTTILARLNGVDTNAGRTWYEPGMNWALGKGLTDKTDALSSIPREEIAVMLYRNAGSPAVSGDLSRFHDAGSISAYAKDAMLWAVQEGIFAGMGNGILSPQGNATRAQVATILQRLLLK